MIKIQGNELVEEHTEYCDLHLDCGHFRTWAYPIPHGPETLHRYLHLKMLRELYNPIIKEQLESPALLQRPTERRGDGQSE